jgi:hypothetical protein
MVDWAAIQSWATLAIAVVALLFSGLALWRGRTPKPHWDFANEVGVWGDSMTGYQLIAQWTVTQQGPGEAEQVAAAYRVNGGKWQTGSDEKRMRRHETLGGHLTLKDSEASAVRLEVRVTWRHLPDTRTARSKVFKTVIPPHGPLPARQEPQWAKPTPPKDDWA